MKNIFILVFYIHIPQNYIPYVFIMLGELLTAEGKMW